MPLLSWLSWCWRCPPGFPSEISSVGFKLIESRWVVDFRVVLDVYVAGMAAISPVSLAGWRRAMEVFGQVATVADLPLVVGVVEVGSDEADDGGVVGEDADDAGAVFDLAVDPFDRVGRPDLGPVLPGEGGEGEDLGLWPHPSTVRSWGSYGRVGLGPGPRPGRRRWHRVGRTRSGRGRRPCLCGTSARGRGGCGRSGPPC